MCVNMHIRIFKNALKIYIHILIFYPYMHGASHCDPQPLACNLLINGYIFVTIDYECGSQNMEHVCT